MHRHLPTIFPNAYRYPPQTNSSHRTIKQPKTNLSNNTNNRRILPSQQWPLSYTPNQPKPINSSSSKQLHTKPNHHITNTLSSTKTLRANNLNNNTNIPIQIYHTIPRSKHNVNPITSIHRRTSLRSQPPRSSSHNQHASRNSIHVLTTKTFNSNSKHLVPPTGPSNRSKRSYPTPIT